MILKAYIVVMLFLMLIHRFPPELWNFRKYEAPRIPFFLTKVGFLAYYFK